jgi:hypothetical protein
MIVKKVTRYYADCGKSYSSKSYCLWHEKVCKCWTNPKFRTCKTCKFGRTAVITDILDNPDAAILRPRIVRQCANPRFDYEIHFKKAHEKAEGLCIDCPVWVQKTSK